MNDIINDIKLNAELHMQKCITNFKDSINKIHIGRISPSILDRMQVEYYGVLTPLSQLTNAVVENSRTLVVTVFHLKMIKLIEKVILDSKIGLNSVISGNMLRVTLPCLTEERRFHLIKMVRVEAEKSRVSIRNIRRYINEKTRSLSKDKKINIDEEHCFQNKIQKITDFWVKEIDYILKKKESELMIF